MQTQRCPAHFDTVPQTIILLLSKKHDARVNKQVIKLNILRVAVVAAPY